MPASPIPSDQQTEIDSVLLIASSVRARGSYTEPFGEAVRTLNGVCARIFHAPDPEPQRAAGAS